MREYSLREHKQIIDAYIALGYDLDTITLTKGFYQPDAAAVLKGYGFKLGPAWGDDTDDMGRFKKVPQVVVNEYVEKYYPGNAQVTMSEYLEKQRPDWYNAKDTYKSIFSRKLTVEEENMMQSQNAQIQPEQKRKKRKWTSLY